MTVPSASRLPRPPRRRLWPLTGLTSAPSFVAPSEARGLSPRGTNVTASKRTLGGRCGEILRWAQNDGSFRLPPPPPPPPPTLAAYRSHIRAILRRPERSEGSLPTRHQRHCQQENPRRSMRRD